MAQEIADSKLIDTWGSSGAKVEPDISKIIEGWQLGEQPPHEYMNWLQNTFGSKLNHILKNGVASWNNETEYLAGSSVQHNGNVWLCKTTNTDSEPTDINSNWKRIITVESLTTVLGGYVKNTGNEDIDGIKNFLESPRVPTPTTGDNSTKVATTAFVKAKSEADSIGVGQTWQNVTASRSMGVTYTNTTGKPIFVNISTGFANINDIELKIGGVVVAFAYTDTDTENVKTISGIVPNNTTYLVTTPSGGAFTRWVELR